MTPEAIPPSPSTQILESGEDDFPKDGLAISHSLNYFKFVERMLRCRKCQIFPDMVIVLEALNRVN